MSLPLRSEMGRADAIKWTPKLESDVLEEIESGSTLRVTAAKFEISASAIIRHVQQNEEFGKQYARAIDIRTDADCDSLADQIAQDAESTQYGVDSGWVAWQRVRIDTLKWLLSKRNPKKYGDKAALTGPNGEGPAQIVIRHIASDGE